MKLATLRDGSRDGRTPFMAVGDRIRIEASIAGTSPGASPFGAIDQRVVAAGTIVSGAQPTPGAQP